MEDIFDYFYAAGRVNFMQFLQQELALHGAYNINIETDYGNTVYPNYRGSFSRNGANFEFSFALLEGVFVDFVLKRNNRIIKEEPEIGEVRQLVNALFNRTINLPYDANFDLNDNNKKIFPNGNKYYRFLVVIQNYLTIKISNNLSTVKIVLAYSGGLDTSVIIPWLKENYNAEVITYTADLGQDEDLSGVKDKALKSGAIDAVVENITKEFVEDYVFPLLKSGAKYENTYLNGTISRPLIAKKLVEVARKYKADAICHGATGKGNDQVRFEASIMALAPDLKVVVPWREWSFKSREELMDYAKAHGIPVEATKKSPYSIDRNILYVSHEGGVLEDCKNEFPKEVLKMTQHPENAVDEAENVKLTFEKGVPVAVNDKKMNSVEVMQTLNKLGHKHGIGLIDIVEDRMVGMKSRGTYEFPGGEIIYQAHQKLESITLTKDAWLYKQKMALDYANLVYSAGWYTQLKECMDAFINKTQEQVSGEVVVKLYKGSVFSVSISSPNSLYNPNLAGFTMGEEYNQKDAEGFIKIFGLPMKVFGGVRGK